MKVPFRSTSSPLWTLAKFYIKETFKYPRIGTQYRSFSSHPFETHVKDDYNGSSHALISRIAHSYM
jgi:hypothetical protein